MRKDFLKEFEKNRMTNVIGLRSNITIRRNGRTHATVVRTIISDLNGVPCVKYNHKLLPIRPSLMWYMADEY